MSLCFFLLVSFSEHPGKTSPTNPLDKTSNPESPLSGFSGHGKIESNKVEHFVVSLHMPSFSLIHFCARNNVKIKSKSVILILQQPESRRITHISAEQKRRFNIKLGFDTLHNLVTTLSSQPSIKVPSEQVENVKNRRAERWRRRASPKHESVDAHSNFKKNRWSVSTDKNAP